MAARDAAGRKRRDAVRSLGGSPEDGPEIRARARVPFDRELGALQRAVLRRLAGGSPLAEALDQLARGVEALGDGMLVSILLLDSDGRHVRHGAAPSLPPSFTQAIDGEPIGPDAGSCGAAAYRRAPVYVEDIEHDPLWERYREAALDHGLRACWSTPILDADGSVLGTFALYFREVRRPAKRHLRVIEWVTDLAAVAIQIKRAEGGLRESRTMLEALFDAADVVLNILEVVSDDDARYVIANPYTASVWGADDELRDRRLSELGLPEADRRRWIAQLRDASASGDQVREEIPIPTPTGVRWFLRNLVPIGDGGAVRAAVAGFDVTDRRRAVEALRESETRLRLFVEHAPAAIAMFDRRMVYLAASRRWLTDYRIADEEVVGRSHYEVFPDLPARWREVHRRCLEGAVERSDGDPFPRDDGRTDWVRWEIRPWHDAGGEIGGLILFSEVITERVEAEEALRRLTAELEERVAERTAELAARQRELEAFTYSVSHDLKAPLRGLDGYSRLLLEDHAAGLDEEGRTFVRTIRGAAQQMSQLIDDLLAYSRLERRAFETRPIEILPVIRALAAELARRDVVDPPQVVIELPDVRVHADPDGLVLVLRNLFDNAAKFRRDGAPARITVSARVDDQRVEIAVRDEGIGFEMRYHDRIFEIFQRLHPADRYPGTGIGLAIAARAAERLGGSLRAESEPGRGATFFLEVPR